MPGLVGSRAETGLRGGIVKRNSVDSNWRSWEKSRVDTVLNACDFRGVQQTGVRLPYTCKTSLDTEVQPTQGLLNTRLTCVSRGVGHFWIVPISANAGMGFSFFCCTGAVFRLDTFRLRWLDRGRKSLCPGAWVREPRARGRQRSSSGNSLGDLRAERLVSQGQSEATDRRAIFFERKHGALGVPVPFARSLPPSYPLKSSVPFVPGFHPLPSTCPPVFWNSQQSESFKDAFAGHQHKQPSCSVFPAFVHVSPGVPHV